MDSEKLDIFKKEIASLVPKIKTDELPEPYYTICSLVGVEKTLLIAKELGGTRYYFPKFESLFRDDRNSLIYDAFTGTNYRDLAKQHNLSETRIREIINEEHNRRFKQINLFEQIG